MRYFIATYGCQANKADSERIARRLKNAGYNKAERLESADLVVINACSVRQSAIDRAYSKIKKLKNKKIILAGCVLPEDRKKFKKEVAEIWHPDEYFDYKPINSKKFSTLVPITKGCDNFCSYCAVPYTRGREKSRPSKEIVKEINNLIKSGYKEIWLLGQNVNSYKDNKINFPKLLKIINSISGKFWIRFMSPHPKDANDEFIDTFAKCEKAAKFLNLPVQSGDNEILKKMNRNYTREHYINLIKKIKNKIPNISISTDTIVGFPSETKKQFLNTANLYKKIGFDMAFIAKYSPRPGTFAALTMEDNVSVKEKEKRRIILNEILKKTAMKNNKKLIGKKEEVLVDSEKDERFFGRTRGNKSIEITGKNLRIGEFINVKITYADSWRLKGELEKPKIIALIGPTASGKSDLAVEIARQFNGEIISADSRQVYKSMNIGTGKITKKEMQGIKHYLLNVAEPKRTFTAAEYKELAEKAIKEILEKGKIPVVCGGTGFYINSLLSGIEMPKVEPDKKMREELEKKNAEQLFEILKKIDPERAKNIDSKNPRRLIRAIEIVKKLGKVPLIKTGEKKYEILWIGIEKSEKELKTRIEKRIKGMLKQGLLKEIKKLHESGLGWEKISQFGFEYKYPAQYLQNKISREKMLEKMITENWRYAKRQMTWFKKYSPETKWIKSKNEAFRPVNDFLKI